MLCVGKINIYATGASEDVFQCWSVGTRIKHGLDYSNLTYQ